MIEEQARDERSESETGRTGGNAFMLRITNKQEGMGCRRKGVGGLKPRTARDRWSLVSGRPHGSRRENGEAISMIAKKLASQVHVASLHAQCRPPSHLCMATASTCCPLRFQTHTLLRPAPQCQRLPPKPTALQLALPTVCKKISHPTTARDPSRGQSVVKDKHFPVPWPPYRCAPADVAA